MALPRIDTLTHPRIAACTRQFANLSMRGHVDASMRDIVFTFSLWLSFFRFHLKPLLWRLSIVMESNESAGLNKLEGGNQGHLL